MTQEIEDPELLALVERLKSLANVEAVVRASLMIKGPGAARERKRLVTSAIGRLAGLESTGGYIGQVLRHLRASSSLSRTRRIKDALDILVTCRRRTRIDVDHRAHELGVVVDPLQVITNASAAQVSEVAKQIDGISKQGGLDAFDASLSGDESPDRGGS